ncbi:MAG: tetratricopeptide repeat protein [Aliidongia sp.]
MTTSLSSLRLALAGTGLGLILALAGPAAFAADKQPEQNKDEAVRPEVGKPLTEAQDAIKAKNWDLALSKLGEADAAKDKTPYETYAIDRTRGVAASGKGDQATAAKAFSAAIETGKMKPEDQLNMMAVVTSLYGQAKDYANATAWGQRYLKAGGTDAQVKTIIVQAEYLSGDYASAARDAQAQIAATEQAGQKPTEAQYTLLASAYLKQNNDAGYVSVLEQFVVAYPSKERWADLISHVDHKPGFDNRLLLDVNRLQRATGSLSANCAAMVELDLQDGVSSEAKSVAEDSACSVPKALQAKAAAAAAEDRKKLDRDAKDAEGFKDGNVLVTIGYTFVGFGEHQKGIAALEQGIGKGGLKHPDEAKLMLGIAYFQAGQYPKAIDTFNAIKGGNGAADLAHLWALRAKQGA